MAGIARKLARRVFAIRAERGAIPDQRPDFARDPAALAADRSFKRWLRAAGWLGCDLDLLAALAGTDKYGVHAYTPVYQALLRARRRQRVALLEIGVGGYGQAPGGESLLMWAAYFRKGRIYGIDVADSTALSQGRVKVFQCSQVDRARLTRLAEEIGPFDVVIDDGSHRSEHQIESFRILWPFVKEGGLYIVEDVQTSYWPSFGGGELGTPACQNSCMSYFKRLADSVNQAEFLAPAEAGLELQSAIGSIAFHHNLIVLSKDSSARRSNLPLHDPKLRALLRKPG
jgi:hypothetical protein